MIRATSNSFLVGILAMVAIPANADWPAFRGQNASGTSDERGLPVKWGPKENMVWKARLPGPGGSSPIVAGDRVLVTCYSGHDNDNLNQLRRHLLCLDRKTGKVLWQKDIAAELPESDYKNQVREHGYATHTPVTDGQRVYVYFGKTGALAFDMDGQELWQTQLGKIVNTFGSGASPVLFQNLLLINATVERGSLFALDRKTGKEVWRAKGLPDCWSTPVVVAVPGGKPELIHNGAEALLGFDPTTGEKLWECELPSLVYSSVTPVVRDGVVYVMGAGANGRWFMAVRAGGRGDVTRSHILWTQKVGASYGSPVLAGDRLYFLSRLFYCLRADNGEIVFEERLAGLGQEYSSPVVADGKLYFFTRFRGAYVIALKDKPEVLAHNTLDDASDFNASPAVSHGQLLTRSNEYLYCLGQPK